MLGSLLRANAARVLYIFDGFDEAEDELAADAFQEDLLGLVAEEGSFEWLCYSIITSRTERAAAFPNGRVLTIQML